MKVWVGGGTADFVWRSASTGLEWGMEVWSGSPDHGGAGRKNTFTEGSLAQKCFQNPGDLHVQADPGDPKLGLETRESEDSLQNKTFYGECLCWPKRSPRALRPLISIRKTGFD